MASLFKNTKDKDLLKVTKVFELTSYLGWGEGGSAFLVPKRSFESGNKIFLISHAKCQRITAQTLARIFD